jgi:hypothetical protein
LESFDLASLVQGRIEAVWRPILTSECCSNPFVNRLWT